MFAGRVSVDVRATRDASKLTIGYAPDPPPPTVYVAADKVNTPLLVVPANEDWNLPAVPVMF